MESCRGRDENACELAFYDSSLVGQEYIPNPDLFIIHCERNQVNSFNSFRAIQFQEEFLTVTENYIY